MIVYPPWWRGGSADAERTMKDLFTFPENVAAQGLSGVDVRAWLPTPDVARAWMDQGNGILRAYRTGGRINRDVYPWVDESQVQFAAWCSSRDAAWDLIEYVREMLLAYTDGGQVQRSAPTRSGLTTTYIRVPGELLGPELIPELILDDKLVLSTFEIHIDRPKSLPDYRELLQLDH